jgi:hypothetical protein
MRIIELIEYAHRYQSKRYRQYLVEIDDPTIHHSGGEVLALADFLISNQLHL